MNADPDLFKAAMRKLAATVALVTTNEDGVRHGMPATAVTSLSVDPPSLLVCINRSASMHAPTDRSGFFCVNLLSADQMATCREFGARPSGERFATGDWRQGHEQLPFLSDAAASLFCAVEERLSYGTHTVFIGRVLEAIVDAARQPLVFAGGEMGCFAADPGGKMQGRNQ